MLADIIRQRAVADAEKQKQEQKRLLEAAPAFVERIKRDIRDAVESDNTKPGKYIVTYCPAVYPEVAIVFNRNMPFISELQAWAKSEGVVLGFEEAPTFLPQDRYCAAPIDGYGIILALL